MHTFVNFFSLEVPIKIQIKKEERLINQDEFPKPNTTLDGLSKLKPCFLSENGTVTPGNASGINDGAALLLLTSFSEAKSKNLTPLARVVSWSQHGCDPLVMGIAPIEAIRLALQKAEWSLDKVDLFEINEAFASQSLAILRELKIDESKVITISENLMF